MFEVKFKNIIEFNGYEFFYYNEFSEFLASNFNYALRLLQDNSLFDIIDEGDPYLNIALKEATKNFKYQENIISYIICKLSNSSIFVTPSHSFKTTYEMMIEMKRTYPNVNQELYRLLKDPVLSKIYLDEYNFTKESKDKRTHDFMIHVEENSEYIYSYYYFFLLHLPSSEKISFVINNITFDSLDELCSYMYTNGKYIKTLIKEIKENDYVLALLASKTSINSLTIAIQSDNYLDTLYLLNGVSDYDFRTLLMKKMSYWLADNYHNYEYTSNKAKKLLEQYSMIIKKEDMTFLEMFTLVKKLEELYKSFLELYKSDRIIERTNYIIPRTEEFHFGYFYNEEFVCSKFLSDLELIEVNIYSEEYIMSHEKLIVTNELNDQIARLGKADTLLTQYYELFDVNRFKVVNLRTLFMFLLLLPISVGLIFNINYNISSLELIVLKVFSIPSLILLIASLVFILPEYNKLSDILAKKKKYIKYLKKINNTKIELAKVQYEKQEDGSIVNKKINLNYFKSFDGFCNSAKKISKKEVSIKSYDINLLNIVTIAVAFFPAISFLNHIIFSFLGLELSYLIFVSFPILYFVFVAINIFLLTKEKFYRNTFILYIVSLITTVIINFI